MFNGCSFVELKDIIYTLFPPITYFLLKIFLKEVADLYSLINELVLNLIAGIISLSLLYLWVCH
jgi:hypothetical protein